MADAARAERIEVDPFVAEVTRLLLTFLFVIAIDAVMVSLITHRLRFWFPLWLDPLWATRADPWVIYSQSYFAGIFMIPILCRFIDRDFVARLGTGARAAFDQNWLTEPCLQMLPDCSGQCVRRTARRERIDDFDRPVRVVLRKHGCGVDRQNKPECEGGGGTNSQHGIPFN